MSTRATVFAVVLAAGCGGGEEPIDPAAVPRDPAADGPWQVGVTTIDVPDPVSGRMLTVELWYPATPEPGDEPETTLGIETTAVRGAPPDPRGGPFPLIAFSHGSGGLRVQSVYATLHLASWGHVVVAPDHPDDTLAGSDLEDRPAVFRARPRQITLSIDAALAHAATPGDLVHGLIDPSRIGVIGHSFGAFTSLVLAGARVDVTALRAACTAEPDQLVCGGLDAELVQAEVDAFPDPRISAAVALAPAGVVSFGPTGLAAATAPVQIQGGTADTFSTPAGEIEPLFAGLPAPKSFGLITAAAHFSFTDICALYELTGGATGPLGFLATEGCGDTTIPIARAHAASRTLAAAFFDLHLRGVADTAGYLAPGGVADTDVR